MACLAPRGSPAALFGIVGPSLRGSGGSSTRKTSGDSAVGARRWEKTLSTKSARRASTGARAVNPEGNPPGAHTRVAGDDQSASRVLQLLRVNAIVELTGGVAILVFPGVAGAGLECSQWYGLTLCCVALASYLASRTTAPDVRDGVSPVVGGMLAYHLGISGFQIRRLAAVATGAGGGAGAGVIAAGALGVHAPLAALFALAAVYCFGRR